MAHGRESYEALRNGEVFGIIEDLQQMQGHDDLIVLVRQQLPDDLREAVILNDDQEERPGALDGWIRGHGDPGGPVTGWRWQVGWHDDDNATLDSQARLSDRSLITDPAQVEAYAFLCEMMEREHQTSISTHAEPEESPVPDVGEGGFPEINEE